MMRLPMLVALLPLAACSTAGDGDYPSLAPRPQEKLGFAEPEPPALAPAAADPALDATLATIARDRADAARAFDLAAARAERAAAAARGARAGSDMWLDAQTALGALDALRGRHADAVGAMEELAATRAQALQPAYPPLDAAIVAARAAAAAQDARTSAVAARLARN